MSVKVSIKLRKNQLRFIKGVLGWMGDEVKLGFSPEGLEVLAVDPAHVAMAHLTLSAKRMNALFLDEYVCTEAIDIGMELDNISADLLRCDGNEFRLAFDDEGHIDIEGRLSTVTIDEYLEFLMVNRRFTQVSAEGMLNPKWPRLKFIGHFTTNGAHFLKAMRMMENISDHIAFLATPNYGAAMMAEDSVGNVQAIGMSSKATVDSGEENVRSMFPVDYTKSIAMALKDCKTVTIDMHNDLPVCYSAELEGVKVEYLMAPRIDG